MAWYVVSDVARRLLGKLAQWKEDGLVARMGDTYFGGRNKLKPLEETLRMIQAEYGAVERRLALWDENEADDFKKMVKTMKHMLYRMEDLFEEMDIVETQRDDQQRSAGWNYKLIKSLCMSDSKPSLFRAKVKQISESTVQQVEALMAIDWSSVKQQWRNTDEGDQFDDEDDLYNRQFAIKQCLAYCSLFPKDHLFNKTDLIHLWMAQGFLEPLNANHQTPQQVGHQYFLHLLDVGVFQEAARNQLCDMWKMDDQSRQMATRMARAECLLVDDELEDLIDTHSCIHLHHVSFIIGSSWQAPAWLLDAKQLRSLLLFPRYESSISVTIIKNVRELLLNLKCLRALNLGRANHDSVLQAANNIEGLKHLRYLNFGSSLESIPKSITRLHYLEALDLQACRSIMKIPDKLNKNVKFVFGTENKYQISVDESNGLYRQIGAVQTFGKLDIFFKRHCRGAVSEASATDLKNKVVNSLLLEWSSLYQEPDAHADKDQEDVILENLKPPSSLDTLVVRFWRGTRFPSWEPSRYVNLPNLVSIAVMGCDRCRYLPSFSRLPFLRNLSLADLRALEYIEEIDEDIGSEAYYPSLKNLKLEELPELMGWSKGTRQQAFPQLSQLQISVCPKLMSLPHTKTLDSICVEEIHGDLLKHIPATSTLPTNSKQLERLQIDSVHQLSSLAVNLVPEDCLIIKSCEDLVSIKLSSNSAQLKEYSIFKRRLEVYNCSKLRHVSGFGVEKLKIWHCDELKLWDISEDKSPSWKVLESITELRLGCITKLTSFPMDIGNLAKGIERLYLFQLPNFRGLSDWLSTLRSIRELDIVECPNLTTLFDPDCGVKKLFQDAMRLNIERCRRLVNISFKEDKTTFWRLRVCGCDKLQVISGKVLEIRGLEVDGCPELALWENNSISSAAFDCVGSATSASAWQLFSRLKSLTLKRSLKLEHLPEGIACLTNLEHLTISKLPNLRQLPQWIRKLSSLTIEDCRLNLRMLFETSPRTVVGSTTASAWQPLTTLEELRLGGISKLESLPEGIACLSGPSRLQISKLEDLSELPEWIGQFSELWCLEIEDCPKLTTLPESLWEIPSLSELSIRRCNPELKSKCQEPTGEYWPQLQRIYRVEVV